MVVSICPRGFNLRGCFPRGRVCLGFRVRSMPGTNKNPVAGLYGAFEFSKFSGFWVCRVSVLLCSFSVELGNPTPGWLL